MNFLRRSRPWRCEVPVAGLLSAGAAGVTLYLMLPPAVISWWRPAPDEMRIAVLTAALSAALAAVGAMVFFLHCSFSEGKLTEKLGIAPPGGREWRAIFAGFVLIALGAGLLTEGWCRLLRKNGIAFESGQMLMRWAAEATWPEYFLLLALTAFVVPVAEELFFRRILYALILPSGLFTAWFGVSALFAAAHGFLPGVPGLFWMGAGFQYLYCRTGNLAVPILCHAFLNAAAVTLAFFSGTAEW